MRKPSARPTGPDRPRRTIRSQDDDQDGADRASGPIARRSWPRRCLPTLNAAVPVALLAAAVYYACSERPRDEPRASDGPRTSERPRTSDGPLRTVSAGHSLLEPFALDHRPLLERRSASVEKWRRDHRWLVAYDERGVDRRTNLSVDEFRDIYDGVWPVLISDVVDKWPAYNWTGEFLNQHYGQEQVVMKAVDLHLDAAISQVFPELYQLSGAITHQNGLSEAVSIAVPLYRFYENTDKAHPKSWTYVEDELFIPMRPELRNDIGDNEYLREDFFQLFPEDVRPWNAMLLWGTKYSRSSLHVDPYNWTGTNAVIRGHKWWKLYPPGQDEYLYVMKDKRSGFPLDCYKYNSIVDAFDPDLEKYPLFKKAVSILFEQLPGEMLIIPSGWFHQAYNSEETLAISSQVMNRNNYRVVLEEILKAENINREDLPPNIDELSPEEQVKKVMSLLPQELIVRGRTVTQSILKQMKAKSDQYMEGEGPLLSKRQV